MRASVGDGAASSGRSASAKRGSAAGPVSPGERVAGLDVARGVAVLGILLANVQTFAMVGAASQSPLAYGDFRGANRGGWYAYLLVDPSFLVLFALLFGAGVALAHRRAGASRESSVAHTRRMLALIALGALHAYLVWYADILLTLGVCGLLAYLARDASPGRLLSVSTALAAVPFALSALLSVVYAAEVIAASLRHAWDPGLAAVLAETRAYRGAWLEQMAVRVPSALGKHTWGLGLDVGWRVTGAMLAGMAGAKLGLVEGRHPRVLVALLALGLGVGFPLTLVGAREILSPDRDPVWALRFGTPLHNAAGALMGLGWAGGVLLLCRAVPERYTALLAATGRMSLTNYLLQSALCSLLFYGHGLGWFGSVDRVGQLEIVLAIWAAEIALSALWLRRFPFGPFEWLWRAATYAQLRLTAAGSRSARADGGARPRP